MKAVAIMIAVVSLCGTVKDSKLPDLIPGYVCQIMTNYNGNVPIWQLVELDQLRGPTYLYCGAQCFPVLHIKLTFVKKTHSFHKMSTLLGKICRSKPYN